ncbi:MAG: peptide-binding protein [Candidatus Aureabacteria bacterium]|nr:peptide-binding protein [Candidatus Auribacterota bacterium]
MRALSRIIFSAAVILLPFLSVSPAPAQEQPVAGDSLVESSIGDARILIPFLADDSASSDICGRIFNGLVKYDKDLNLVGDLARSWEVSSDYKTLTFHLREGVRWQDGASCEAIFVPDPLTVVFRYREPYAPALSKLGMGVIPRHILEGKDLRKSVFARRPLGTGPYVFQEWRTDEYTILKANPGYFEGRPFLDRWITRIIPDQAVEYLEFITGGVDLMSLTPHQYRFRSESEPFRRTGVKYTYRTGAYSFIGYNLLDPLFQDVRVRRALGMAVNKRQIIEGVLLGLGEPVTGPFWKGTWAYNDAVPDLPYDPASGRALLKECGWEDRDGDGVLEKDGRPFQFKLITNQGNKVREDTATIVQRQWAEVGVRAEVQVIAWPTFLSEFIDKKKFQAIILGWTMPVDPDPYNVWHSESSGEGELNFISYRNPEVDELIIKGVRTFDQAERRKIYHRIHELIARDQPYTFLYTPHSLVAVNRRIRGIEPAPAGLSWNLIKWWVPQGEQKYLY